ncbi:MAG: alpha/beta hydrolase [Candidatus Helarchaeota archaeon]|nr:alpha/beta hydrolase [Candidatus Helarchaeota archaeon]
MKSRMFMTRSNNVLILVHGAMGSHRAWHYQVEKLSTKIKVIAVDLPGDSKAEAPKAPKMDTYVTFLDELLNEIKPNKVILGGQSMGGAVILSYSFQYPDKVDGLILVGTGARLRVLPAILELSQSNYPELIRMVGKAAFHKRTYENNKPLIAEVAKNMALISPQVAYHNWKICNEFDVMERLGEIQIPTLIICGDEDKLTPIKYSKYLNEHIKNSSLYVIEGAGHMVMLEQPDAVNEAIEKFLERF